MNVSKKLSVKIGLIKRLRPLLPNYVLLKLYPPLFQSNLDYCLTVWATLLNSKNYKIGLLES